MHRGLPGTSLTVVFALDEPLECGWADGAMRARRWVTVSGLHAAPAAIHQGGRQRGVQLGLTTAGAAALLGVPAAELAGELLDADDLGLDEVPERLHETSDPAGEVLRVLARALAERGDRAPRAEVGRALAGLTRGESVAAVAAEVGYSRRRLGTLVREECGLTPKEYQRVARFERAHGLLGHRPLAEVAAWCGYADQGHLAREWRALAGCTPTTWLREEFPFLQDLTGARRGRLRP